jgi:DNA polymerase III alpha subunit
MTTPTIREALARLIELDEQAPTGFEIGTDPQWTSDWDQAIHQARQALAPKIAMNQAAWLNVAICAAQRAKIAIQEANSLKLEDRRRRLLTNREIDETDTVNMAFNRAAGTRVLLDSVTFRWMFDYSELDQTVIEEEP